MMVAIGAQLSGLSKAQGSEAIVLFGLSFSTILVSWFLVQAKAALLRQTTAQGRGNVPAT